MAIKNIVLTIFVKSNKDGWYYISGYNIYVDKNGKIRDKYLENFSTRNNDILETLFKAISGEGNPNTGWLKAAQQLSALALLVQMTYSGYGHILGTWKLPPSKVKKAKNPSEVVESGAKEVVQQGGKKVFSKEIIFNGSSVDKAFSKHRDAFGKYPDGTKNSINAFISDLKKFADTGVQKKGSWKQFKGTHIYDPKTKNWMFINQDGSFNTAFRLNDEQYKHLIESGKVGK
ncbi:hypothetical protein [Pilibacter termitis]|uniref:hypothetical protein n=1 Tax=Pilibacter termitis TaxID=263852 RepID=UPI001185F4C3|nr:hypothetical protein [Pilibacter termitis]